MTEKKTPYHRPGLREALVAAGRTLLEEKGLRGFTLRECARRAEVSHAAPAHHFASINDLLAEIATRGFRELKAAMEVEADKGGAAGDSGAAAGRLVGQGMGYMAFAAAHPMLFRLMFNRETEDFATPELVAAAKENRELQAAAIAAAAVSVYNVSAAAQRPSAVAADVTLRRARRPVAITHTGCRAIADHPRKLRTARDSRLKKG